MKPRYFSVSEKLVLPDCPSFVCHPLAEFPTVWRRHASRVCFLERWTPERRRASGTLLWSGDHLRCCERQGECFCPSLCARSLQGKLLVCRCYVVSLFPVSSGLRRALMVRVAGEGSW